MEAQLEATRCKVAKTTHARTWGVSKAAPALVMSPIAAGLEPGIAAVWAVLAAWVVPAVLAGWVVLAVAAVWAAPAAWAEPAIAAAAIA
jgi:hypothetical protein